MNIWKIFIFIIFTMFSFSYVIAQNITFHLNKWIQLSQDSTSKFYYPELIERFLQNDTTLSDEELIFLRVGYTQESEYKPLKQWMIEDTLDHYNKLKEYHKTLRCGLLYLQNNPVSLRGNLAMMRAYGKLGKNIEQRRYRTRYLQLMGAILGSGNGYSSNSAYLVINSNEEKPVINYLGYISISSFGSLDGSGQHDVWLVVSKKDTTDRRTFVFDSSIPYDYSINNPNENESYYSPFPEPNIDKHFYCTPDTAYLGDTVVLHFPMPHDNDELVLSPTKGNLYYIHVPYEGVASDSGGRHSIISDSKFIATSRMKFPTKTFMARPNVYGKKKEIVFNKTSYYEFEMAHNLEDDSGVRGITAGVYFINRHKKNK